MDLYKISDIEESYGDTSLSYQHLGVKTELEKGESNKHKWGDNLALTLIDTIEYCKKIDNFFVPSASLFAQIYTQCLKDKDDHKAESIMKDLNNYWHRTMTIIVFPVDGQKGYVVHYPHSNGAELVRKEGRIVGDVIIDLEDDEIPAYGKIAYLNENKSFYDKVFGNDVASKLSGIVEKELKFTPCVWIPPKTAIESSPERLAIFGGFTQYGQGLWLTSNSRDKTLIGTRPFRGVYSL